MDWFGDHLSVTWLVIALALVAIEIVSTDLIFVMLAAGAVVAMVLALVGAPFLLQVIVGVVVSIALIALLRPPLLQRLHAGPTLTSGAPGVIGKRATVLEEIAHAAPGRVKIGGDVWSALPFDEDDRIEPGTDVEVVSIKGGMAFVLRAHRPTEGERGE
ncbi:MAG: NfeD family protein [Nocardioidaceae bacterium]|nr:NfeD family protein [Nocardioidaceae bacterium]